MPFAALTLGDKTVLNVHSLPRAVLLFVSKPESLPLAPSLLHTYFTAEIVVQRWVDLFTVITIVGTIFESVSRITIANAWLTYIYLH